MQTKKMCAVIVTICAAVVLFFQGKSVWNISMLTTSRPLSIAMTGNPTRPPQDLGNIGGFVLVPISSVGACAGRVSHLTCLKMCVTDDLGTLRWGPNMSNMLCEKLLAGRREVAEANVGLCVQHRGRIGAVVLAQSLNASETEFEKGAIAQDFEQVLVALPSPSRVRTVSRKTIRMPDFGKLQEPASRLNFTNHTQAWEMAMAMDNNLGNAIWKFGAKNLLNPYTTMESPLEMLPDAFLVPVENILYIPDHKADRLPKPVETKTLRALEAAEQLNVPSILIGIGLQAELPQNKSLEQAIELMQMHHFSVALLKTFASRAPHAGIPVRGNITSYMCRKVGVQACVPLGCPSLTINRAKDLGLVLKNAWTGALRKSMTSSMRLAIHLPQHQRGAKFHEEAYKILIRLYSEYDSIFVLQSDYDYPQLKSRLFQAGIRWDTSRVIFFTSVDDWLDHMKKVDFVIGCRIHGTMAAVSAGTASLILPTDFRTLEMAQAMKIPMIAGAQLNELHAATFNLTAIMEKVFNRFNFTEFEENRRTAIRAYADILAGMELEIHPDLLEIVL